jgi:poly(A) polymerase
MEISLEKIDPDALRVVQRLRRFQHQAFLVGGCVRDLLLGRKPKDFDVATSATPNEIRRTFRNCRIIGRRFRLAHVFFGRKIIETATFRANPREIEEEVVAGAEPTPAAEPAPGAEPTPAAEPTPDLYIRRDNVFGNAVEDAMRRDFTINGLFYDVETKQVIDHVQGLPDLEARILRTIGDPDIRFREDPIRILRAVKFAARCELTIEPETYRRMMEHKHELAKCSQPRVTEEFFRLLRTGAGRRSFELLLETGLLEFMLPQLDSILRDEKQALHHQRFWSYLRAMDESIAERSEPPSDAMILATLLLPLLRDLFAANAPPVQNISQTVTEVMTPFIDRIKASRRDSELCRQILIAMRYMLPDARRRPHSNLATRPFYSDAQWLAQIIAKAEGMVIPATSDTADQAGEPLNDEDLPAELLVDVDGGNGSYDRRGHRGRNRQNGDRPEHSPAQHGSMPAVHEPPQLWEIQRPGLSPIPSLEWLVTSSSERPAFLGNGTFGGRWATRCD